MRLTAEKNIGVIDWRRSRANGRTPYRSTVWLVISCLAGGGMHSLIAADGKDRFSARPALSEIVYGGRSIPVTGNAQEDSIGEVSYDGISLHPGEFPLNIGLNTMDPGNPPVVRIRTRLEGWESEWQEHESQMYLVLRFIDENNRAVSSESFIRKGDSPGWGGLPQNSRWHRQVDEVVVPERSKRVQILLVSGGTPRTTGFWAVRHLDLTVQAPGNEKAPGTLIYRLEPLRGSELESPRGNPSDWLRDGTGLEIPRLHAHAGENGVIEPLLALVDTNPDNTGGWLQKVNSAPPVVPGQRLRLASEEMYSIGRGHDAQVSFHLLPVGNYVFRAWATDVLGRPTGPSLRLPVEVRPPFYAASWFRLLGLGVIGAGLLGAVRYFTWRKMQRKLQQMERSRAIAEERTRMARDIHDEMGSRFTQISLLAGRALLAAPVDESVREPIRNINGAVKQLASALEEIVWAANPLHDTLEGFSNYLSQYSGTVIRDAGLRCRLDIPALLPSLELPAGLRHRLMMAVKEALNNALKHAHATEVWVRLELDGPRLLLTVTDDGGGFDPETVKRGNGLDHLEQRMEEIGGTCQVESRLAGGTCIRLTVPLPAAKEVS
jgi:signal transduction histidine kinase